MSDPVSNPAPNPDSYSEAPPASATTNSSFPGDHSLCEDCGYSLRGLSIAGDCPECGKAIEASSPTHRIGLPWQNRVNPWTWLQTARLMAFAPSKAFSIFRLDIPSSDPSEGKTNRNNWRARVFLALIAGGMGLIWYLYWRTAHGIRPLQWGISATVGLLLLTYIETIGVAFFSGRRGWRVPLATAERIACYASVGWIPAGLVLLKVFMWHDHPVLNGPFDLFKGDARDYPWMVSIGAASILWFEWLVWFGCRRLKYANR